MKKRHIIGLLISAYFILTSVRALEEIISYHRSAVTGTVEIVGTANDPDYDLGKSYPLIFRKVEMAQYDREKKDRNSRIYFNVLGLHDSQVYHYIRVKGTRKNENPDFPKWVSSEIFGEVIINDGKQTLRLGKAAARKLIDIYINNAPDLFIVERKLVQGGEEGWKNKMLVDYYPNETKLRLGDVVVTWYAITPDVLAQTHTVAGSAKDGVIGGIDYLVEVYDKEMTIVDILIAYIKGASNILGIIGVIVAVNCVKGILRSRKEQQETGGAQSS